MYVRAEMWFSCEAEAAMKADMGEGEDAQTDVLQSGFCESIRMSGWKHYRKYEKKTQAVNKQVRSVYTYIDQCM